MLYSISHNTSLKLLVDTLAALGIIVNDSSESELENALGEYSGTVQLERPRFNIRVRTIEPDDLKEFLRRKNLLLNENDFGKKELRRIEAAYRYTIVMSIWNNDYFGYSSASKMLRALPQKFNFVSYSAFGLSVKGDADTIRNIGWSQYLNNEELISFSRKNEILDEFFDDSIILSIISQRNLIQEVQNFRNVLLGVLNI